MYRVKESYGINEPLLKILAKDDEAWETAYKIWEKSKLLRLDRLTQEQMTCLEAIEMDLQEQEQLYVMQIMSQ
jgi:hypothetical protein